MAAGSSHHKTGLEGFENRPRFNDLLPLYKNVKITSFSRPTRFSWLLNVKSSRSRASRSLGDLWPTFLISDVCLVAPRTGANPFRSLIFFECCKTLCERQLWPKSVFLRCLVRLALGGCFSDVYSPDHFEQPSEASGQTGLRSFAEFLPLRVEQWRQAAMTRNFAFLLLLCLDHGVLDHVEWSHASIVFPKEVRPTYTHSDCNQNL